MKDDASPTKKPSLTTSLIQIGHKLQRFMVLWFVVLLAGVYGFVIFRIQSAETIQQNPNDVASQLRAVSTPHVDQKVVDQMLSLQDHSVNVKTLFDKARRNPFQE